MIDQSVPEEIQSVNNTQVHVPAVLPQIGLTLLNPSISPMQGIFVEVLITFVLIITIFACVDAHRKDLGGSFPLTIGFAVTVGALMGVGFCYCLFLKILSKFYKKKAFFNKLVLFMLRVNSRVDQ